MPRGFGELGAARRRTEAARRPVPGYKALGEPGLPEVSGAAWGSLPPRSRTQPQAFLTRRLRLTGLPRLLRLKPRLQGRVATGRFGV